MCLCFTLVWPLPLWKPTNCWTVEMFSYNFFNNWTCNQLKEMQYDSQVVFQRLQCLQGFVMHWQRGQKTCTQLKTHTAATICYLQRYLNVRWRRAHSYTLCALETVCVPFLIFTKKNYDVISFGPNEPTTLFVCSKYLLQLLKNTKHY